MSLSTEEINALAPHLPTELILKLFGGDKEQIELVKSMSKAYISEVYFKKALEGDINAAKLYLEMNGIEADDNDNEIIIERKFICT